jgi:hypothetical protein
VFMSLTSVHDDPFHVSVTAKPPGGLPPKAIDDVLSAPTPACLCLAVFKSLTSVQDDPFQDSVIPVFEGVLPPKIKDDV